MLIFCECQFSGLTKLEKKFKTKKWALDYSSQILNLFYVHKIFNSFLPLIVACEAATNCSGHETCRASGSSWSCCTIQSKCKIHEGDCDSDDECEGTLTCGIRNCDVHLFPENADCCQEQGNKSYILKSRGILKFSAILNLFCASTMIYPLHFSSSYILFSKMIH